MPTLAPPDSEFNAKLRKENARFERESIKNAVYRAVCTQCEWTWKSEHATEDLEAGRTLMASLAAEDRANAHAAIERHEVDIVFDLIGCHYTTIRPAAVLR